MLTFPDEAIIVNNIENIFNGIVVVMPSVGRNHIPKFSRHSWKNDFEDFCFIAVADPELIFHEDNEQINGTWFLTKRKGYMSWLDLLAKYLENLIKKFCNGDKVPIVFCGSSMGGYAALVMSTYFESSVALSECPQTVLLDYKHSRIAIDSLQLSESNTFIDLRTLFSETKLKPAGKIFCALSDLHHIKYHVQPLIEFISQQAQDFHMSRRELEIELKIGAETPFGHKQLPRKVFKNEVLKLMLSAKNSCAD